MRKKIFFTLGIAALLLGIVLLVIGFADFFGSMESRERPQYFFLTMIGFPLVGAGIILLAIANAGRLQKHALRRANEMSDVLTKQKVVCPACGAVTENAPFCTACGQKLTQTTPCPHCNTQNAADAGFCGACGTKLK